MRGHAAQGQIMQTSQTELLAEYAGDMTSETGRQLLRYLFDRGAVLQSHSFQLRTKGYLKTGRYENAAGWPFAFIVNRANVLFYVRRAGLSHPNATVAVLASKFDDVTVNSRGEIRFHVNSEAQAKVLMGLLFGEPASPLVDRAA